MPNYYQLIPKGKSEPAILNKIDEAICRDVFQCEVHPTKWCRDWHNQIGFALSVGDSWEKIDADLKADMEKETDESAKDWFRDLLKISAYLQEHYGVNCGYETKY
jgi:hypothetical protein